MIENNHIDELIIRYILNEIKKEELSELEDWLQESEENKTYFFQLKQISDSSHRIIWSETQKEESWERMYKLIKNYNQKNSHIHESGSAHSLAPRSLRLKLIWKYAAIIVFVLGLGWTLFLSVKKQQNTLEYSEVKIEKGGRNSTLILADGSKVILNVSSTLKYPLNFSGKSRTVYLEGEAYFEIAKDESKPFIVKLKKQDITVLGTSFNVEAYSDESRSKVSLLSGAISLDTYNEDGKAMSKMFLKPNQEAVSDNLSGSVSIRDVDISLSEMWISGKYKFRDESLGNITKRLEKYYNVHINIEDEMLKKIKFTGTFSLNQDIQEVLNILDHENQYKVKQLDKEIFIVKK